MKKQKTVQGLRLSQIDMSKNKRVSDWRASAGEESSKPGLQEKSMSVVSSLLNTKFIGQCSDLRALLQRLQLAHHWNLFRTHELLLVSQLRERLRTDEDADDLRNKLLGTGMSLDGQEALFRAVRHKVRVPRVLCLHGFCTSSGILRTMIKPLIMQLHADFTFIDGSKRRADVMPDKPEVASIKAGWPDEEQLLYAVKQEKLKTPATEGPGGRKVDAVYETSYADLREAMATIFDEVREHGPFDGLVAYSQGANIGTILAAAAGAGLIEGQPPFKFVCAFCGSEWGWARQARQLWPEADLFPIRTPAVIIQGSEDPLGFPQAQRAFRNCYDISQRVELFHESGHMPFGPDLYQAWRLAEAVKEVVTAATMDLDSFHEHDPPSASNGPLPTSHPVTAAASAPPAAEQRASSAAEPPAVAPPKRDVAPPGGPQNGSAWTFADDQDGAFRSDAPAPAQDLSA